MSGGAAHGGQTAQGPTELAFLVTAEGTTKDITVAKSSGVSALDDAAIRCVATWRYTPATANGTPVEFPWKAVVGWTVH